MKQNTKFRVPLWNWTSVEYQETIWNRVVYTIYENVVYRIPYIVYNDTNTIINEKYTIHFMGARWLWKLGGHINKTVKAQYKSVGAPLVKIKDFTLASQNLGGGTCPPPRALHTGRPWIHIWYYWYMINIQYINLYVWYCIDFISSCIFSICRPLNFLYFF